MGSGGDPRNQQQRTSPHTAGSASMGESAGGSAKQGRELAKQPHESGKRIHRVPPAQFSTPLTAFTMRSHSSRSAAICRLPASVRK